MSSLSRREFVRKTTLAAVAAQLASTLRAEAELTSAAAREPTAPLKPGVAPLRWLDRKAPTVLAGTTWGTPWPQGQHSRETTFSLRSDDGTAVAVQSWPLAYWPDGSLKWTGQAIPAGARVSDQLELVAGAPAPLSTRLTVQDGADGIVIDTGVMRCELPKRGDVAIRRLVRGTREVASNGRLICLREDRSRADQGIAETFLGACDSITLEQSGPVRAVVKIEGKHQAGERGWLPFVVRLYFYAGGDTIRMVHTVVYDGDEKQDFIRGLGVRFSVPMRGALHDRHVRFAGEEDGLFGEAVRGITGLRRDPGAEVRAAQIEGRATPPLEAWSPRVSGGLQYIPAFGDWTLFQGSCDGFEISKRTREGFTWISAARGNRAGGFGYVGTPQGGLAFGIRNFWQSYPGQLDVRGAAGDEAEVTAWLWAPNAGAMDLRPYHDGLGEDTYEKQVAAMDVTYEDHEPGFDRPIGVARTSELYFTACEATPTRVRLAEMASAVRNPPVLVAAPAYLHACQVFGGLWSPVDRSTPARAELEDKLDWHFDFYRGQQEQRRWYGFWNYGDVMHTYDADRHEWRYDIGGFAWDNSELSTDLWLWLHFLRTGDANAFRFAEAMTRHTGEVDVHHLGPFAPLGSRHNVLHWGCSAKQLRISTAANRRYYYYLTADERVGDLMREQIEAVRTLATILPTRKVSREPLPPPNPQATEAPVGFGTDWSSVAAAWLTEWERTGDAKIRERLIASMRTIGQQPRGFFTGSAMMNFDSGVFEISKSDRAGASHLSAVFGLVEVCAELVQLLDVPEFKRAWLDYCELYNAPADLQKARLGRALGDLNLGQGHSRLTAFAAKQTGDPALARRAWSEFYRGSAGYRADVKTASKRVSGPSVTRPVDEAAFVSTNATAQWGLAAIQCLALVPEAQPPKAG